MCMRWNKMAAKAIGWGNRVVPWDSYKVHLGNLWVINRDLRYYIKKGCDYHAEDCVLKTVSHRWGTWFNFEGWN